MKWLLPLVALVAILPRNGSGQTTIGTSILTLPYTITAPGIYHFGKTLYYSPTSTPAITIKSNDVVLDLDEHELVCTSGSTAVGIFSSGSFSNLVIKDGVIRGFHAGVQLAANAACISDLLVIGSIGNGIFVQGYNAQILRNRVYNTAETSSTNGRTIGISLTGTDGTVRDNDVQNTVAADVAGHICNGIRLANCSTVVVSNNRILDTEPMVPTAATSTGIATVSCTDLVILGNTVVSAQTGFDLSGCAGGEYGDNIATNVKTGYLLTNGTANSGMVSIGNNN